MNLLTLVTATRLDRQSFWKETLLGRSLRLFPREFLPRLVIAFQNQEGLSSIYNRAIESAPADHNILFVHDDVYVHDLFLQQRVAEALSRYDVVGLAGSRHSDPEQPSWCLAFDRNLKPISWQKDEGLPDGIVMSGAVSHLQQGDERSDQPPEPALSLYGNAPARCHLLDGLFLASRVSMLRESGVRFDPRFAFHFYDLDFSRTAMGAGLSLGTWPILVTHKSGGNFSDETFRRAAREYLSKWKGVPFGQSRPASSSEAAQ